MWVEHLGWLGQPGGGRVIMMEIAMFGDSIRVGLSQWKAVFAYCVHT